MQIKKGARNIFKWPVKVRRPSPEVAGAIVEESFVMVFEAMPEQVMLDQLREGAGLSNEEMVDRRHEPHLLVAVGWEDVVDEDGAPVPFSKELLREWLDIRWHSDAYLAAYTEGMAAGRTGN